jgi:hypothetical protein
MDVGTQLALAVYASTLFPPLLRAMLRIPQLDDSAYTDSRRNAILTLEYFGTWPLPVSVRSSREHVGAHLGHPDVLHDVMLQERPWLP